MLILIFPSSNNSVKAGPFGVCGKWVETGMCGERCIYHFFKCECLVGSVIEECGEQSS